MKPLCCADTKCVQHVILWCYVVNVKFINAYIRRQLHEAFVANGHIDTETEIDKES